MIMNKQYSIKVIVTFLLSLNMIFQVSLYSQEVRAIVVKDESGNPISGAMVTIGEEAKPVITDERGEFILSTDVNLPVLIEADGFDPIIVNSLGLTSVELKKAPYQSGKSDEVYVPFGKFKKREIAGAVTVLNTQDILKYDQHKTVRGVINGRVPGFYGSTEVRGLGNPLFVIDGVPRQGIDINLQEIDQITVLKDLSTMMLYGTHANNGVVLITTKRGDPLKKEMNFIAESGLNFPISYPNYLSAADYMELYNEALTNDELEIRYSSEEISATRSGTNSIRYPDIDYYSSTFLKNSASYYYINGEMRQGNETGQFYLNLGWNRNNSLLAIGEGANEKTDILNLRGNVDYKVSDMIHLLFDGAIIFNFSNGPRYTSDSNDFWRLSTTFRPNIYQPLIPANLITSEEMLAGAKLYDNKYVLGGTSEYLVNIYGELTRNGLRKTYDRLIEMNAGLDFDLSRITEGLNLKTFMSFDMYSMFSEGLLNSYAVYRPNFAADNTISSFTKLDTDVKVHERTIQDVDYFRRYGTFGNLEYKKAFGDNKISANALVYVYHYSEQMVYQPNKTLHYGLRFNYTFKDKYITELTGVYAGSGKLYYTDHRFAFSPGIGLGWIASEENFLKDNSVINYLKFRTNWALNNTDQNINNYRLGTDYYGISGGYYFDHGSYYNPGRVFYPGNTDLKMEKVMNFNLGFESMLFNYRLGIEGSYFYHNNYDLVTQRANVLPTYFGSQEYENYGSYKRQGIEAELNYLLNIADIKIKLGTNLTYSVSKLLKWDELQYAEDYRRNVGKSADAIFGYVALGLFKDKSDINNHAEQTFGNVQPGDIKYQDLNNDGVIDDRDQKIIGNSKPTVQYGFNIQLSYKALQFFALATGQIGRDQYFNNEYYWVYGDRKYSEVILNRWTPATAASADYPRLSYTVNSNNFRNSTFWLYKSNWFGLHTVQMTYTLSGKNFIGLNNVSFFVRGNNLLTISQIKDKLELNVGSVPQMRVFSLGLKLMF